MINSDTLSFVLYPLSLRYHLACLLSPCPGQEGRGKEKKGQVQVGTQYLDVEGRGL
jgi:hypothetical protein